MSASNTVRCVFFTLQFLTNYPCKDVVIVEDDPYYFLQYETYVPKDARMASGAASRFSGDSERFVASLVPSFLKYEFLHCYLNRSQLII